MPYRRAWLFVVALIALSVAAFWRSYFGMLATAPAGFHIHGLTASLWMLLLLAQTRTVALKDRAVHRALGRVTFVAVPLFTAGAAGVVHSMASAMIGGNPFYAMWGAPLAVFDLLAFGAMIAIVALALRHRRNVWLHGGYMLSTGLLLVSPALGRLLNQTVPGLVIHGPPDFPLFRWSMHLANAIVVAIAAYAYRSNPRHGRPWAIVGTLTIVQSVGFELLGPVPAWRAMFAAFAGIPLAAMLSLGAVAGLAAVWWGWTAGVRPRTATAAT